MPMEFSYSPNLQSEDVFKFMFDNSQNQLIGPLPRESGFSSGASMKSGSFSTKFGFQRKEYYHVLDNGNVAGNLDFIVPLERPILIDIFSHLLIRDNIQASVSQKMIDIFNGYPSGVDPYEYAFQHMSQIGVTSDMFIVESSFAIQKNGALIEYPEKRDAVLSLYTQPQVDTILHVFGDTSLNDYFTRRRYSTVFIRSENIYSLLPSPSDPHIIESTNPSDIDEVIREEATRQDCNSSDRVLEQIATILSYPEFKQEWNWVVVKIGCVKTHLYLPKTYKRMTKEIMYAYSSHPSNINQIILDIVKGCVIKAAISAAVIGVILANFGAALAAFKALFIECIKFQTQEEIKCLLPGLIITKQPGPWSIV